MILGALGFKQTLFRLKNKPVTKWVVIGLVSLCVFAYSWSFMSGRLGNTFSQDSYGYFLLGKNLMDGLGFTSPSARDFNVDPTWPVVGKSFPPFYPLLVGVMNKATGYGIRSNALVNMVILALFIGALIYFFHLLADWAWIVAMLSFVIFVATNGHYREEVLAGRSIPTMMLGFIGFAMFFMKSLEEKHRFYRPEILGGICLAIMMHTRFDQTLFCVGVIALSFVLYRMHGAPNFAALKKSGAIFGAFFLASLPWMVRNMIRFGMPFASDNSVAVLSTYPSLVGICHWPLGAEPDTIFTNFDLWVDQRSRYFLANIKKIADVTSYLIYWVPILPLLTWRILTHRQRSFTLIAYLHIVCTILSISISPYGDLRYFSAIHLNLLIMAFMCGVAVVDFFATPVVEKVLFYVVLAAIAVLPLTEERRKPITAHLLAGRLLPNNVDNHARRYGEMARVFSPHMTEDPTVAVHHDAEIFTYYTGYRTIYYPLNLKRQTEGLADWIVKWNVDYLVLFTRMVHALKMDDYVLGNASGRTLVDARAFVANKRVIQ